MANQIAAFFAAYPEDEAVSSTYQHILQFWDPRMRSDLIRHIADDGADLSRIARAAAVRLSKSVAAENRHSNA